VESLGPIKERETVAVVKTDLTTWFYYYVKSIEARCLSGQSNAASQSV